MLEILRSSPISTIMYPAYRGVAGHLLSLLWQQAKTEEGKAGLMAESPKCPGIICDKLDKKEPDRCDMGLDLELMSQVQSTVWAYFREMQLRQATDSR